MKRAETKMHTAFILAIVFSASLHAVPQKRKMTTNIPEDITPWFDRKWRQGEIELID